MLRFYLPFNSATSPLSRKDLIRARTVYQPTYSPGAGATGNDISYRVLQYELRVNEALVSKVTALMESVAPPREPPYIGLCQCA
jgi:hypothetical protein